MDAAVPTVSSRRLCEILGISYRQLDYACRTNPVLAAKNEGSGNRRRFTPPEAARLYIARLLTDAVPTISSATVWPLAAAQTMTGRTPPPAGFAVLSPDGWLTYHQSLDLARLGTGTVGVVVRYDLSEAPQDDQGFPLYGMEPAAA